ncbi:MAG: conjugal transfer protein TraX [Coriobacteriia bacterium]|nr:conjugal transfer protein TraX [Coriobacteriia bacterium]
MDDKAFATDSFSLKVIAIVGMTANHFGHAFYAQLPFVARCILIGMGGLTFPIMAYQISVGYQYTRDVKKYALRLFVFALVSLVPFIWVLGNKLNVIFTLLLGLLVVWADDKLQGSAQKRFVFFIVLTSAVVITHWCDWSYIGVPMILLYHRGRDQNWRVYLPIALVWYMGFASLVELLSSDYISQIWQYYIPNLLYCFVGATATIPLLRAYNGQQGRPMKYFFYVYYPLHITVIGILRGLLFSIWG